VHVDEFQTFSSDAFASLLSEARKFATHFTLANQYTDQLPPAVRSAVIGNAGTLVVFRVAVAMPNLLRRNFVRWTQARLRIKSRSPPGSGAVQDATAFSPSHHCTSRLARATPSNLKANSASADRAKPSRSGYADDTMSEKQSRATHIK
jgi:hypothetical protein